MTHGDLAERYFLDGFNCAQAVLLAFSDLTGLEQDTAARLASSFGGGLGRMREVCGAVSGASMVLGLLKGYSDPKDADAKRDHYHLIQEFARLYRAENGSIICREMLNGTAAKPGNEPEARTQEYYRKRPCPQLVRHAAEIVDDLLKI